MLGRTLKMAFWVFHDHLGKLLIVNVIWAIAVFLPVSVAIPAFMTGDLRTILYVGVPSAFVAAFIVSPILGAGIAHMVKVFIDTRDGRLSDFFSGIRLYTFRSMGVGMVYGLAMTAFLSSAWFYTTKLESTAPIVGYALGGLALGCAGVLGVTSLLLMPAIVQRKVGVFATLKLTLLLTLANPGLAFGLLVQAVAISAVTAAFWPILVACYASVLICLGSAAYELLARKYAATEAGATEPLDDAKDDYLNRGLRDLFFPWKG